MPDVTVVGSGPNGMAAAVTMARAGLTVEVFEREATIGGGARSLQLTLPGYLHDVGAAVHPMAFASPFFRSFELDRRVDFVVPEVSYAHPIGSGGGVAFHDLDRTAERLGVDGRAWRSLLRPLVDHIDDVTDFTGSQLLRIPRGPVTAARVGLRTIEQGTALWNTRFRGDFAAAMLSGVAAHSIGRMPSLPSAGVGLVLAAHAHARGWPIPVGGSQSIIDAMRDDLLAHGGVIHTGTDVSDVRDLPPAAVNLMDVAPRALASIGAGVLPDSYLRRMRSFRYGDGVAKVDFALNGPVPWTLPEARQAGTLHLGGDRAAIALAESEVAAGRHAADPYVLVSQPSLFDPSRAPATKHSLWAYIHVPRGSDRDPTADVIRMIERSAPGFRDLIEASTSMSAMQLEQYDPNLIGGDISIGALSLRQMVGRPVFSTRPWRTPRKGMYLASSATPPATGVHGLCGFYAARTALADVFNLPVPDLGISLR